MNNTRSSVSIALATYNGAAFLREQLDSLLVQTLPPLELVVGDDRSDDGTLTILRAFAETAPFPVRILVNERRLHFSENFIRVASRCRGRYVAFCDQDDVWSPHKLHRAVEALDGADAHLCGHDAWLIDARGVRIGRHAHLRRAGVFEPLTLHPWGIFFGFATLIRRDLLGTLPSDLRGPDPLDPDRALSHDRWAYFLGTTLGRTVYLDEPLADYRQHGANIFGGGTRPGLRNRVFTNPRSVELHLDACGRRATLLAGAGAYSETVRAGAAHWRRLEAIYRLRTALALDRSAVGRGRCLARLVGAGAYRGSATGGLGLRAFAKDALATVTARRLDRPAAPSAQELAR